VINKLILRPLPVTQPQDLVYLNTTNGISHSYLNYKDFRDRNHTLAGLLGYRLAQVAMSQVSGTLHVWGYEVTGNYFDVLGVQAMLGRAITPADDQQIGAHPVVVLSYNNWKRHFGADPAIVGKTVKINRLDYTILGVMPRGFFGTELLFASDFWVPLAMEPQIEPGNPWLNNRNTWNLWVAGRLKPATTRSQAEAELNTITVQMAREYPALEGMRIHLSPPGLAGNWMRGAVIGLASVLMGVAGLVLLIACANLASLLLAQASDRRKEIALRLTLGAARWRLVRQLLTENLLLAIAGSVAGLLLAVWLVDLLGGWRPPIDIPADFGLVIDWRVLTFTAAAGLLTTLLFGLAPALQAARAQLVPALKNASFTERLRRWQPRELLVTTQIALSVILLVSTVLVVRSLQNSLTINIGFNPRGAVGVLFDLALEGYDETHGRDFQQRLLEKVSALPGIQSAGFANSLPLGLDQSSTGVYGEGKPLPKPSERQGANYYMVDPGYFRTMQTRLVTGRDFDPHDSRNSQRVAIVNQTFAARVFPHESAVGRRFSHSPDDHNWIEIVGIAEDGKYVSLNDGPTPVVFWPALQQYNSTTFVVARSPLPAERVVRLIGRAVHELDPGVPFIQAGSLDDHLRLPLFPARLAATMLGAFGTLAIVLAATGVYGVMAYAVSRRRREIGIRVAIGASDGQVMRLVLNRIAALLMVGTAFGMLTALATGNLFAPVLYGISPRDPATFMLAALLMAVVALAAGWLPARRALSIEPASALREE